MYLLGESTLGVVILCPYCNFAGLRDTYNSIKSELEDTACVAMVGGNASDSDLRDLSRITQVYRGGKTITSLIDVGAKKLKTDWVITISAGVRIKYNIIKKYGTFLKSNKDILFPVIDRKHLFHEASINGILLSREAIEDVGEFGDEVEDLVSAKLLWAGEALNKGYKFKALVGAKLI
jgi:hypothetical protein